MSFEDSHQTQRVTHATLVFEREVPAAIDKVFAAFVNAKARAEWGAPSDTATLIYDHEDFREGGEDRFRCGSRSNPNIHGTTRYLEIIPGRRIVSSETISMTSQVASFIGQDMIKGTEIGNNGSLDSLVNYLSRQQA